MAKVHARKLTRVSEDVSRIRIKPAPDKADELPISRPGRSLVDVLSDSESDNFVDIGALNEFRTMSQDREQQYQIYDDMKQDSVIASALEMYADDSTQYDRKGNVIWVDSEDTNIAAFGNRLIDILQLNENSWSYIYSLCLYGDLYLQVFMDNETEGIIVNDKPVNYSQVNIDDIPRGIKMKEYIEIVPNPAEMFDLVDMGKTVGFLRSPTLTSERNNYGSYYSYSLNSEDSTQTIYDPRKFIHIAIGKDINRFPERIQISFKDDNGDLKSSGIITKEYTVNRGKSILHDIYKVYQELKLMEDSILLNRITRSSIIRLLQVEVGDMGKSQVNNVLKRLKQMMEQRNMLNKNDSSFKSQAAPGPIDNIIYIPTRNGKGQVSMSNIGGDVDIKSIADIDYFNNKLFAGLKIPKQFLGQDNNEGLGSGQSLTKIDSRYARTIKRIQNAYISGITTLINLYALDKGLPDYVNQFTVKMVSPSSTEDNERDESMSSKMDLIGSFVELLGDAYSPDTKKQVFEYLLSTMMSEPEIVEILKEDKGPENEDDLEDGEFGDSSFDSGSDDIDLDVNFDDSSNEFEPIDSTSDDSVNDTSDFGDSGDSEEFGDFETNF